VRSALSGIARFQSMGRGNDRPDLRRRGHAAVPEPHGLRVELEVLVEADRVRLLRERLPCSMRQTRTKRTARDDAAHLTANRTPQAFGPPRSTPRPAAAHPSNARQVRATTAPGRTSLSALATVGTPRYSFAPQRSSHTRESPPSRPLTCQRHCSTKGTRGYSMWVRRGQA
jgi:hypothetical protein